jgi:hemerythrin-like domain-containing protein
MDPESDITIASPKNDNLRKRYNKLVVIDLGKRAILRNLVKQNTLCEHKQIYTQANAICRRISSSYEEGRISAQEALQLMIEAHNQMSHHGLPKEVIADEMNKRISKLEKGENTNFEVTMANVSHANNLEDKENSSLKNEDSSNKYSESYWSEVI